MTAAVHRVAVGRDRLADGGWGMVAELIAETRNGFRRAELTASPHEDPRFVTITAREVGRGGCSEQHPAARGVCERGPGWHRRHASETARPGATYRCTDVWPWPNPEPAP